jgi:biopolymer transport protein ExbB/TolQ
MSLSLVELSSSPTPWLDAFKRMRRDDRELRRELQDAQTDRAAADARAKIARDTLDRATAASREAVGHVARLRADVDAARRAATGHAAKRFEEALRGGSELPATPLPQSSPIAPR